MLIDFEEILNYFDLKRGHSFKSFIGNSYRKYIKFFIKNFNFILHNIFFKHIIKTGKYTLCQFSFTGNVIL
jgi:hypothetical protein